MTCATIFGARPSDGSSSSSTRGADISALAMTRICRSPPDSVPAARRRRSASTVNRREATFRASARPARSRRASAPRRRFSSTVSSVMTPWPSGTCATPARAMSSGRRRARFVPPTRILPCRGRTNPLIVRSRVVLPAPLAPSTAVIVPALAEIDTPSSTVTPPYPATISSTASAAALLMAGLLRPCGRRTLARRAGALLAPEVGGGHRRISLHLLWRARRDQPAEVQHEYRVADRHHQVHPVLDHHHAGLVAHAPDHVAHLQHLLLL